MAHPSDFKFSPIDQNLVAYYLRNRVDTGKDGFITDIKLYEDEPWLLPHVKNDQFKENTWFYFVVRTRKLGSRPSRTVPGRGSSNGGTWTTTGVKKAITTDGNPKVVIGYKTELAYHKKVNGKPKGDTTGWCMTEYWLASENDAQFQEVVLCHLRDNNKMVVDQPQQEKSDDNNDNKNNGSRLGLQTIMGYSDNATQEQQHPQIALPPQRQDSGSITIPLLITEDECVNQDEIFDLADLEAGITQRQQQQHQMIDTSPWNNTNPRGLIFNTHGY